MKKILFLAALLSLAACNKNGLDGAAVEPGRGECVLTARFEAPATKVANQTLTNEKAIQNVQIFVFRAGDGADKGVLEIAASAGFDQPLGVTAGTFSGISVKCSTGYREVWAVVNDSRDRTSGTDAVRTKAEFLALTHELADASSTCLLMIGRSNPGSQDPAILLVEGSMQVTVPVHRLAASVVLESVKNDFSSPAYQRPDMFRLEAAYLLNVPGRIDFGERSEPSALPAEMWYARLAAETANPRAAILYDNLSGEIVQYGGVHASTHTFYTYPNNCRPNEDAVFCPRATVLVLEASIKYAVGWVKFYYPVTLDGGLQANKQYRVNLTVHRPGSLDPNKPVAFNDVTPVINVSDWDGGVTYNPEI
jgi:hypothetical protein